MDEPSQESTTEPPHASAQLLAVRDSDANRVTTAVPVAFRLCNLSTHHDGVKHQYVADLYHDIVTVPVCWSASRTKPALRENALVRPFSATRELEAGRTRIGSVSVLHRPEAGLALFRSIPPAWNIPHALLARITRLLDALPEDYRGLVNAIFWDPDRLQRFCTAPASVSNHHAYRHGLLEHTVEVAENTLRLCAASPDANRDLVLLAALLHDAGKADEYVPRGTRSWELTDRGKLIGHDATIVEWISAALAHAGVGVELPEQAHLGLLHVITARRGAPDWLGLRQPAMLESDILSQADRLSGQINLHAQHRNPSGGWGRKHRHMRSAPYSLPRR